MKKNIFLLCSFFIILISCNKDSRIVEPRIISFQPPVAGKINWQPTNGPYGGNINIIVANRNGYLFAGTRNGIYISQNNGVIWKLSSIQNADIKLICTDKDGNIFTTYSGFLYISSNNGETWNEKYIRSQISINDMKISETGEIYLAICNRGILHSTNNGDTWREDTIKSGFCSSYLTLNTKGHIYVASSSARGISFSKDNCKTWTSIGSNILNISPNFLYISGNDQIYVGFPNLGIYSSKDNGQNWELLKNELGSLYLNRLFIDPNGKLFLGTNQGLFTSIDNGQSWKLSGLNEPINTITQNDNKQIFAGSKFDGIFRSDDNGNNWESVSKGLDICSINQLAINSKGKVFALRLTTLYCSSDDGNSWIKINKDGLINKILFIDSKDIIYSSSQNGVLRSSDDGKSWLKLNLEYTDAFENRLVEDYKGNLYFGSPVGSILKSTDNGYTWKEIARVNEYIYSLFVDLRGYIFINTSKILNSVISYSLLCSTNEGKGWQKINLPEENQSFLKLYGDSKGNVFALGKNLIKINYYRNLMFANIIKFPDYSLMNLVISKNDEIIGYNYYGDVYFSNDGGENWKLYLSGEQNFGVNSIAYGSNGYIFAGAYNKGILKAKIR